MMTLLLLLAFSSNTHRIVSQRGHSGPVHQLTISPDGRLLASAGSDREIYLWDLIDGKLVNTFLTTGKVTRLRFRDRGDRLLASSTEGSLHDWRLNDGEHRLLFRTSEPTPVTFDLANGRAVVIGLEENASLTPVVVNLDKATSSTLELSRFPRDLVRLSADGAYAVSGALDHLVVLWDMQRGKPHWRIPTIAGRLLSAAFSPDGKHLVCSVEYPNEQPTIGLTQIEKVHHATRSYGLIVLSVKSGEIVRDLSDYPKAVRAIAWKDNSSFLTGTKSIFQMGNDSLGRYRVDPDEYGGLPEHLEDEISLWQLRSGGRQKLVHGVKVSTLVAHPGKQFFAFDGEHTDTRGNQTFGPTLHDLRSGLQIRRLEPKVHPVSHLASSSDGSRFATTHENDNLIYLWDMNQNRKLRTLAGHQGAVTAIAFRSADILASGSVDGDIRIWDAHSKRLLRTLRGHDRPITALAFLPRSGHLVSASWDENDKGRIILWDSESGQILPAFQRKQQPRKFSQRVERIIPVDENRILFHEYRILYRRMRIRLWDLTKNGWGRLSVGGDVRVASVTPDGSTLWTNKQGHIELYSTASGKRIKRIEGYDYNTAHFLENGQLLAGGKNGFQLWDVNGDQPLSDFHEHHARVRDFVLYPNQTTVLSVEQNGKLMLWDLAENTPGLTIDAVAGTEDYLIYNERGQYMGTAGGRVAAAAIYNQRTGNLHQLKHDNRPDLILARFPNVPEEVIAKHREVARDAGYLDRPAGEKPPELIITNRETLPYLIQGKSVDIEFLAHAGDHPLRELMVWVDGVPQGVEQSLEGRSEQTGTVSIQLGSGPNRIEVAVFDQAGNASPRIEIMVETPSQNIVRDLYLVTLGVSDYPGESRDLAYAARDARDITQFFEKSRLGFNRVHTKALYDAEVTRDRLTEIRTFLEVGKTDDQILFFISGHGTLSQNRFFYATGDTDFADPSQRGLSFEDLDNLLFGLPQRRKLLIMDACHTGRLPQDFQVSAVSSPMPGERNSVLAEASEESKENTNLIDLLFSDLEVRSGSTVLAASQGVELAREESSLGNGVFTYTLLQGLRAGGADLDNDGLIRVSELMNYTNRQVSKYTGGQQNPGYRGANVKLDHPIFPKRRRTNREIPRRASRTPSENQKEIHANANPASGAMILEVSNLDIKVVRDDFSSWESVSSLRVQRVPDEDWFPRSSPLDKRVQRKYGPFRLTYGKSEQNYGDLFIIRTRGNRLGYLLVEMHPVGTTVDNLKEHVLSRDYFKQIQSAWQRYDRSREKLITRPVRPPLEYAKRLDSSAEFILEEPRTIRNRSWLLFVTQDIQTTRKINVGVIYYHYLYAGPEASIVVTYHSGMSMVTGISEKASEAFEKAASTMPERVLFN